MPAIIAASTFGHGDAQRDAARTEKQVQVVQFRFSERLPQEEKVVGSLL
jgi:hypothetical protein